MNQNYQNGNVTNPSYIPNQSTYPPYINIPNQNINNTQDPQYAENLFTLNHGKTVTVYFSYPDSIQWRDKVFTGVILAAGRDYLLLRNNQGETVLLWLVYINYATFEGEISY